MTNERRLTPEAQAAIDAVRQRGFGGGGGGGGVAGVPDPPPTSTSLPPLPSALHWLGDREDADETRHAMDMRGCVLYFEQQSDCLKFMEWLTAQSRAVP